MASSARPGVWVRILVAWRQVVGKVVPLPEGSSYLGFMFARGETPEQVEATLRTAHGHLEIVIAETLPRH